KYQIEAPAISAAPAIGASAIGRSSYATEIGAVVVRVCSQLEEHGKMLLKLDDHGKILYTHGKMLEQISMSSVGDSTLPLGNTLLLGQYQLSTPKKVIKCKRKGGNEKEDGKGRWRSREQKKSIQSTAENLLQQVVPGEILEVANALMIDYDVEVGREVNFNAISSEYGSDLLEKGEEKDNNDKKDVEEKVKYEEEEVQEMEESKNGDEKVDDVAEEEDSE
ncbi:hypothetical protein GIB67_015983, partial [Kingdonia uniflora]